MREEFNGAPSTEFPVESEHCVRARARAWARACARVCVRVCVALCLVLRPQRVQLGPLPPEGGLQHLIQPRVSAGRTRAQCRRVSGGTGALHALGSVGTLWSGSAVDASPPPRSPH